MKQSSSVSCRAANEAHEIALIDVDQAHGLWSQHRTVMSCRNVCHEWCSQSDSWLVQAEINQLPESLKGVEEGTEGSGFQ